MPRQQTRDLQKSSQSRVWTVADRAGPSHAPTYQALARATGLSWGQGSITPIRTPSYTQYGRFDTVDKIRGQEDLPGLSLEFRMTRDLSDILKLVRKGCPFDIQIHVGACKDPTDFDAGWEKIMVLEDADASSYSTGELGALDADQEAVVPETLEAMGTNWYEIKPLAFAGQAESQIVQQVVGVAICDSKTCGACGIPSDGTLRVFAVQVPAGASPGLPSEVVFTTDGGSTWTESIITSLAANEAPSALLCVGPYLVALSNASASLHYALITDLLAGTETWTEQASGFNGSGQPNAAISFGRTLTWIVGDGGYIYFASDPTAAVTAQSSGDVTSEDLNAIHGIDENNLLAGGNNNAILLTSNGGSTWVAVTGPSAQAAANVTAVQMLSDLEWLVGYSDGELWYTIDGGVNWTEKALPGALTQIDGIAFSNRTVGYIIGRTATAGKILRTVSGGYTWYVLPESAGLTVPTANAFEALAVTEDDVNVVWFGGTKTSGGDGILVKGA